MLEAMLIVCLIYSILYMPLRGKSYKMLTQVQKERVQKNYTRYMRTKKGRSTPKMSVEEYLPILQKQAMGYLIGFIVLLPIYILVLILLYPTLLG